MLCLSPLLQDGWKEWDFQTGRGDGSPQNMWSSSPANMHGKRTWKKNNVWRMPSSKSSAGNNSTLLEPVQSLCYRETIFFLLFLGISTAAKSVLQMNLLPKKVGIQPGKYIHFLPVTRITAAEGKNVACIACFVLVGSDFNRTEQWNLDSWKCILILPLASYFRILP